MTHDSSLIPLQSNPFTVHRSPSTQPAPQVPNQTQIIRLFIPQSSIQSDKGFQFNIFNLITHHSSVQSVHRSPFPVHPTTITSPLLALHQINDSHLRFPLGFGSSSTPLTPASQPPLRSSPISSLLTHHSSLSTRSPFPVHPNHPITKKIITQELDT